jgi:MoxR-like ATPase
MAVKLAKSRGVISKVAVGWEDIEAPIIAFVAAEMPFVFQGVHGNAKTTVGNLVGLVYGDGTFRYFDCSKANLIGMAGFPDSEAMKAGKQAFIPNNKSLIGTEENPVRVILLDELTRAPKEAQNLLLEVVEHKTIFGIPTGHRICIATMNPESYKAAMKLDAALIDRFAAYIPVPDYNEFSAEQIEAAIKVNMAQELDSEYFDKVGREFRLITEQVREKYQEMVRDDNICERVAGYCGQLYEISKVRFNADEEAPYISGREQFAQLWRTIIALGAYYVVVKKRELRQALVDGAQEALKYCVVTKHTLNDKHTRVLQMAHKQSKTILMAGGDGPAAKLQIAYAKSLSPQAKLMFLEQYYDDILKHCDAALQNEMLQSTLEDINEYMPANARQRGSLESDKLQMRARLFALSKRRKEFAPTADILEGALLCQLVNGMNNAGYDTNREPYKGALTKSVIKASDIVDLIVALSDNGM